MLSLYEVGLWRSEEMGRVGGCMDIWVDVIALDWMVGGFHSKNVNSFLFSA